ncbi:MAG: beta strand repeat-containing protein [Luteolibacter sp.]
MKPSKTLFLASATLMVLAQDSRADTSLWTGAVSGVWDTSAVNWSNGGSNQYTSGDIVQFGDTGGANLAITISSAVTPASVSFTDTGAGTNAYTFGTSAINGTGTTVTLDSGFGGSVRFNVANGYTGGTNLNGGTLTVNTATSLGTGTVTLNGGIFINSANLTMANAISVTGTTTMYAPVANFIFSGPVTGSGTLNTGGSLGAVASLQFSNNLSGFTGTITHANVNDLNNTTFLNALNTTAKFSTTGATSSSRSMRFEAGGTIGELSGTGGVVLIKGTLNVNQSTDTTFAGPINNIGSGSNAGGLQKSGIGTLILGSNNGYSLATTISDGKLVYKGSSNSPTHSIASGTTLELNYTSGSINSSATTFNGAGTLLKTGGGTAVWGAGVAKFELGAGSLIDVQGGTFTGGSFANDVWTNNLSDLNVASTAIFDGVEANVRVNKITGSGTIKTGLTGNGYTALTFGVDNGSSQFDGVLANSTNIGNIVKAGSGTITLTGASNTYSGTTTVSGGKLTIASGSINSTSGISIAGGELNYNSSTALSKAATFSGTGGTLSGTGTVTPAVTVTSGNTYTPGVKGSAGTQTLTGGVTFNSGSIFQWDINVSGASETGHDTVTNPGGLGGTDAVFNVVLGTGTYAAAFWDTDRSWGDIFSAGTLASVFSSITGTGVVWDPINFRGDVADQGYFTRAANTLSWTAVPEPTSALAGLLITAGLLRRRRHS